MIAILLLLLKAIGTALAFILFVISSGHWLHERFENNLLLRITAGTLAVFLTYLGLEPFLPIPKIETLVASLASGGHTPQTNSPSEDSGLLVDGKQNDDIASADFSGPKIDCRNMNIVHTAGFYYNDAFPSMFGGTWRITSRGGGFTGTFTVPKDGQYVLVVTHGSSYNDSLRRPGYSPVTILVNLKPVVEGYDAAEHHPGFHGMPVDQWLIHAHSGENTIGWVYGSNGETHYWIHSIEIRPI